MLCKKKNVLSDSSIVAETVLPYNDPETQMVNQFNPLHDRGDAFEGSDDPFKDAFEENIRQVYDL
jgi:hypothetical protein